MEFDEVNENEYLKYPARDCRECSYFPCMEIFNTCIDGLGNVVSSDYALNNHLVCNFAQFGCVAYKKAEKKYHVERI